MDFAVEKHEKLFNVIKKMDILTQKQCENEDENSYTILAHLNEELGEVCTAMCVEDGSVVKGYKELDESSSDECVDLVICALSLFFNRGGDMDQLIDISQKKLNKWESKI
jgi:NTP pyrophosphatase (non-canonical NTP hydrolase)